MSQCRSSPLAMGMSQCRSAPLPPPDILHASPVPVTLHTYDVEAAAGCCATGAEGLLGKAPGKFHCGVEVYGWEWSYRRAGPRVKTSTGVFHCPPGLCEGHKHYDGVDLGSTCLSPGRVYMLLQLMEGQWLAADYDPLVRNSAHFCAELCHALQVSEMPAWVQALASSAGVVHGVHAVCPSGSGPGALCNALWEESPASWDLHDEDTPGER